MEKNDFSEQFMPLWKQFVVSQAILLLMWGTFLLTLFLNADLVTKGSSKLLLIFLFILTLIWMSHFFFKLRCPKCSRSVYPYGGYYGGGGRGWIYLTGECCYCGAILKKRKISKVAEKKFKKIVNTVAIIICISIIVIFFYYLVVT